jgi:hypothetical protein
VSRLKLSTAADEVIELEDDEEPQRGAEGETVLPEAPRVRSRRPPSDQTPRGTTAATPPTLVTPLSSAPPATSTLVASAPIGQSQAPPAAPVTAPTHSTPAYPLYHVPEDQTGAAKEAMIQAGQMMLRTKEAYEASKLAYDASSALQANVRVSAIVSSFPIEFLSVLILHPLGVFFASKSGSFWSSGGTLSAPTGCSPRDRCRMTKASTGVLKLF